MKFLQHRDDHFDLCRSSLVICMVITHIFQNFYIYGYTHHVPIINLIGFVFLSGITVAAVYSEKLVIAPKKMSRQLTARAGKLLLIFLVCNLIVILVMPERIVELSKLGFWGLILAIILGTHQSYIAFDVLVPIAVTFFISIFLMRVIRRNTISLILLILFMIMIWILEWLDVFNYYGVKLTIVGIIGCLTGISVRFLDWSRAAERLSKKYSAIIIVGAIIIVYYFFPIFFTKINLAKFSYHLLPTGLIMFFIYMGSYELNLNKWSIIKNINNTLAKYMLFAYLFHILVINIITVFLEENSLDFIKAIGLGLILLTFTILVCYILDFVNAKSALSKRVYNAIFK